MRHGDRPACDGENLIVSLGSSPVSSGRLSQLKRDGLTVAMHIGSPYPYRRDFHSSYRTIRSQASRCELSPQEQE